jgi:transposase
MSKFSKEIKNEVLKDFCDEIKIDVICMRYGVSRATIYNWAKKEKKIKGTEILYIDFYNLERKLQQKTLELEIYEKLHCFKDSTMAEKERAVAKYVGTYPIKTMCRLIDLPTGTAYNYLRRRKEETEYQKRDDI